MASDDTDDSRECPNSQARHPSLDEIRRVHELDSQRISEAIMTGNIDELRISQGAFGRAFRNVPPEKRQATIRRRLQDGVAIRVFSRITQGWKLSGDETIALLGHPDTEVWQAWQNGAGPTIPPDVLEEISYVFGIYESLRILFPNEAQANAWPRKPNKEFEGRSALQVMIEDGPKEVHQYLKSILK